MKIYSETGGADGKAMSKWERALELAIEEMDITCIDCPYYKVCKRDTNEPCKQKLKDYFIYIADVNKPLEELNRYNFNANLEANNASNTKAD